MFYIGNFNYTEGFSENYYSKYFSGTNDWKKGFYYTKKIFRPNGYLDKYSFVLFTTGENYTKE